MEIDDLTLFIGTTPKKLKDIRPGACINENGYLIFKTEYSDERNGNLIPICYNEAGERFHGDYEQLVYPINIGG